jgi:phosphatidylglycerol:prolipoprotein diacylglycerol transferase
LRLGTITIGIDPTVELGPLTLSWHGLTIAIGIAIGAWLAGRVAEQYGYSSQPMGIIATLAALGGLVGGRVLYLLEQGQLTEPGEWLGTHGFSFNGGLALAAVAIAVYVRRTGLPLRYLDALAVGLPLGVVFGRIGDVINGEHYGPATDFVLGVRNTHPDALTPSPDVAFHSGGLYDLLLGAIIFVIVWPLRHHLRRPTEVMWLVIALIGAGRFAEFFVRSDSATVAFGLSSAQWTSLAIFSGGVAGTVIVRRLPRASREHRRRRADGGPRLGRRDELERLHGDPGNLRS